jgi:hypothetical protein
MALVSRLVAFHSFASPYSHEKVTCVDRSIATCPLFIKNECHNDITVGTLFTGSDTNHARWAEL